MLVVDYKLIGSRLKSEREAKQLTQETVAERADITTVYLSKIENGKVHPTLNTLSAICTVIGCDLGTVLLNSASESKDYQSEKVVQLFHACSPEVKPIALELLKGLSKL